MFGISYLDENGNVNQKGGFKSDKEAFEWVIANKNITPLTLLVWSEYIQRYKTLEHF